MAKIKTTLNPVTGESLQAYWIPVQVNINKLARMGQITFLAFASKAARDTKCAPLASRNYTVDNAAYETYFSASALAAAGVDSYAQAYALAMSTLDTEVMPIDGEPQPSVSFFADATDSF